MTKIDFTKLDGLVPAVVQDDASLKVLMVGFMNEEALAETRKTGKVTFFSRSKGRLWTKGETSGNFLEVREILTDCDDDTLLIMAHPTGPVCHTGADTCFGEQNESNLVFLRHLEQIISDRKANPSQQSYTASLFDKGIAKIAQKVGEEAVELVIEAMQQDDVRFREEAADLIFHLLVLLEVKEIPLSSIVESLKMRHSTS